MEKENLPPAKPPTEFFRGFIAVFSFAGAAWLILHYFASVDNNLAFKVVPLGFGLTILWTVAANLIRPQRLVLEVPSKRHHCSVFVLRTLACVRAGVCSGPTGGSGAQGFRCFRFCGVRSDKLGRGERPAAPGRSAEKFQH